MCVCVGGGVGGCARVCVYVCVCVCACACAHGICVCRCTYAYVCARESVGVGNWEGEGKGRGGFLSFSTLQHRVPWACCSFSPHGVRHPARIMSKWTWTLTLTPQRQQRPTYSVGLTEETRVHPERTARLSFLPAITYHGRGHSQSLTLVHHLKLSMTAIVFPLLH